MRLLLILLVFVMASCGASRSYRKAQKSWAKIQEEIKKHPELADSLAIVERDTVKSTEIRYNTVTEKIIDSAAVDSLARLYCEELQKEQKPPGLGKLREQLTTMGCPEISQDTTFQIKVYNSKGSTVLPLGLKIKAKGSRLEVQLDAGSIQLPEENEKLSVNFTCPETPVVKNRWFWISCFLALLLLLSLRRR